MNLNDHPGIVLCSNIRPAAALVPVRIVGFGETGVSSPNLEGTSSMCIYQDTITPT